MIKGHKRRYSEILMIPMPKDKETYDQIAEILQREDYTWINGANPAQYYPSRADILYLDIPLKKLFTVGVNSGTYTDNPKAHMSISDFMDKYVSDPYQDLQNSLDELETKLKTQDETD